MERLRAAILPPRRGYETLEGENEAGTSAAEAPDSLPRNALSPYRRLLRIHRLQIIVFFVTAIFFIASGQVQSVVNSDGSDPQHPRCVLYANWVVRRQANDTLFLTSGESSEPSTCNTTEFGMLGVGILAALCGWLLIFLRPNDRDFYRTGDSGVGCLVYFSLCGGAAGLIASLVFCSTLSLGTSAWCSSFEAVASCGSRIYDRKGLRLLDNYYKSLFTAQILGWIGALFYVLVCVISIMRIAFRLDSIPVSDKQRV